MNDEIKDSLKSAIVELNTEVKALRQIQVSVAKIANATSQRLTDVHNQVGRIDEVLNTLVKHNKLVTHMEEKWTNGMDLVIMTQG